MPPAQVPLHELAILYARLGTTAFGGPAVHIAMMEDEVVRRRHWLTHVEFLDLLGVTNLIPSPNSTEMAIQIGYRVAGWPGLLIGGLCFILPAALITLLMAWAYVHYGMLPGVSGILYGVKAVMIAVVAQAIWNLARTAVKSPRLAVIAALAITASILGYNILGVLFGAGIAAVAAGLPEARRSAGSRAAGFLVPAPLTSPVITPAIPFGLLPLFSLFLKVGAVLFGGGYVLLAFLRSDLVVRLHWLTDKQLLDAVAVGQITPGPVFTTATFIGYQLGGISGAAVATLGIFLPSFVFIALVGPFVPLLRKSVLFGHFLDGVNVGALALMAVVTWHLGRAAIIDATTIVLAATSTVAIVHFRVNSTWLILAGAIVGAIASCALR